MSEAFEKDNSSKAADAQIGFLSFLAQVYCSVWVDGSILQDFARWQNTKLWIKMMMMMVAVVTCMWQCKIAKHDEDTDWHGFGWVGFTRCPKMVCWDCRYCAESGRTKGPCVWEWWQVNLYELWWGIRWWLNVAPWTDGMDLRVRWTA